MTKSIILIVCGPGDEQYISKNIELIDSRNSSSNYEILVVDNRNANGYSGKMKLLEKRKGVTVLEGVSQRFEYSENCRGSYQHGDALNKYVKKLQIQSNLIVLDPDFYIIRNNWIDDFRQKHADGYAFIGVPWHPRWWSKYRGFPCVHCISIDTNAINHKDLNFSPDVYKRAKRKQEREAQKVLEGNCKNKTNRVIRLFKRFGLEKKYEKIRKCVLQNTKGRIFIGSSNDTGYFLFKKYKNRMKGRIYLLSPYADLKVIYKKIIHLNSRLGRRLEMIVPNRFSYYDSSIKISNKSFSNFGFIDFTELDWEEFFYQQEPFGFHLRRFNKKERDPQRELEIINKTIKSL